MRVTYWKKKKGCSIWFSLNQCCGSVTFWYLDPDLPLAYGSGSGYGSCFFRQWLTRCQQVSLQCFASDFLKVHFPQSKSQKEVKKNSKNQAFSYFWCLLMEGPGCGSVTNKDGSRSKRPKNIRLLRIRIHVTLHFTLAKNASLAFNSKVKDL